MLPIGQGLLRAMLVAAALAQGAPWASAQMPTPTKPIYTCQAAGGRTISSDLPIPDCARREMRELNNDGTVRRVISPPLTKDQERDQARLDRQRLEEERERKALQARDRNLLLMFEDERALESMRRRGIADIDHEIQIATMRIVSLERELAIAQRAAETWKTEKAAKALPFAYQQRIADAANAILAENSLISDRRSERERVNSRFDADAKRLRELLGRPSPDDRIAHRIPKS